MASAGEMSDRVSDSDFRAVFTVLPQVLKLTKALFNNGDSQTIHQTSVELSAQLQKCHQVVDATPCLSYSSKEQTLLLEARKQSLKDHVMLLKDIKILPPSN